MGLKIEKLEQFIKEQNILTKEYLTLEELAIYLGQSKSSIYKKTSKRKIPFYSPGGKKLYFKRVEIDKWIFSSRISSNDEERIKVENYLNKTHK